ncbi:MAG: glycosyltransferase, partial [Bacteroidota bacterium]|nr:glycosyltransferase [Bacteroidota bacterium]
EDSFTGGEYIYDQIKSIDKHSEYNIKIIKLVSCFSKEQSYIYNGYNIYIFKAFDFPFFIFPGFFHFINKIRFLFFLKKTNFINKIKYVHAHVSYPAGYLALDLTKKYNIKSIIQHHGLDVLQLNNGRFSIINKIYNQILIKRKLNILNKASLNLAVSKLVFKNLHKFHHYNPKQELVLYNGVDHSKFYLLEDYNFTKFQIGCIANFWHIKDQMTLIKSIERLRDVYEVIDIEVEFIGSGKTLKKCIDYVRKKKLSNQITFLSEVKHTELNLYYNKWSLFVLPSYYEALGCVYLEAFATKTPFIAVKGQGIEEILKSYPHLIEKHDYKGLAENILLFYHKKGATPSLTINTDIDCLVRDFLIHIKSL